MAGINRVTLIGNLGKDSEMRYLPDGKAIASFSIAVSESWKNKEGQKQEHTEWLNITAFGRLAEICSEYLHKGSKVYIEGKIKTDKYEKDGITRYSTKIIANQMQMLDSKSDGGIAEGYQKPQQTQQTQKTKTQHNYNTGADKFDDDIPF